MDKACSTNEGVECISVIGGKAGRKETISKTNTLSGRIILKWTLQQYVDVLCAGLMWLRIVASGRLL
jgi:hypothetical protein